MIISETFFHLDQSAESTTLIKNTFMGLAKEINTVDDVQRFLDIQETFRPEVNAGLEDCCILIMSLEQLKTINCTSGDSVLMYTRSQITGNHWIMIAREILETMPAPLIETLVYHELVHKEQGLRGDLVLSADHVMWKGEARYLVDIGNAIQHAMEQYTELETEAATLLAICENMPWECEAYAKAYAYSKQLDGDFWDPSIMDRVVAIYRKMFA